MTKRIAVAAVFFIATSALAQTQPATTDEVLRALLAEVRALRVTLQQSTAFQLRGQLLLERLRLQQQVVRELSRETDQRNTMMEETQLNAYAEDIEERLRSETNPETRRDLERERDQLKRRIEMQKKMIEEMKQRQQRQEARLIEERQRLEAIEAEIAALQKEMTR